MLVLHVKVNICKVVFRNMVGLKLCWFLKPPNLLAVFGAYTIVAVLSSDDFFGVAVLVLQAPRGVKPTKQELSLRVQRAFWDEVGDRQCTAQTKNENEFPALETIE
jgi:hypothetical protein